MKVCVIGAGGLVGSELCPLLEADGHEVRRGDVPEADVTKGRELALWFGDARPDWIVNLADRRLEVHREPIPDAAAPFGWRYAQTVALAGDARACPLAAPDATVTVADLLP